MSWDNTKLAYLAGLIDADGCIYLDKFRNQRKKENFHYVLRLRIAMTDIEAIIWCKDFFGGNYRPYNFSNYSTHRKIQYIWSLNGKNAVDVLEEVRPFLLVKYRQADIAQEFANTKFNNCKRGRQGRFHCMPAAIRQEKERLCREMRKANQREAA